MGADSDTGRGWSRAFVDCMERHGSGPPMPYPVDLRVLRLAERIRVAPAPASGFIAALDFSPDECHGDTPDEARDGCLTMLEFRRVYHRDGDAFIDMLEAT